jgi:hypothetical protein
LLIGTLMNRCVDVKPFEVETITTTEYQLGLDPAQAELGHDGTMETPPQSAQGHTLSLLPSSPLHVMHATPPSSDINLNNGLDEDAPLWFWRMDNVLGPAEVPGPMEWVFLEEFHIVSNEERTTFEEVMRDPSWRAAMIDELRSTEENCTWDMVDLPAGHRLI